MPELWHSIHPTGPGQLGVSERGIIALVTAGIGVWLSLREAKEDAREKAAAEITAVRTDVDDLEDDVTEARRYAVSLRRILVEHARGKGRFKRDGGQRVHPDLDALAAGGSTEDLLALHDALDQLTAHDPVKARLVELRYFAGLTLEQAAQCLDLSLSTADRAWRYARAWLYPAMGGEEKREK